MSDLYEVVINHEEQYQVVPKGKAIPAGWKKTGVSGTKQQCTKHIEEVWTDMRTAGGAKSPRRPKG